MSLKPATLDAVSDKLSTMMASMTPEDVDGLKSRLAAKLTGGVDAADVLLQMIGEHEEEPEPIAATGGSVQRMARRRATSSPEAATSTGTGLVAAGGALGATAGEPITDRMALGRVMAETLDGLPKDGPSRGRVIVASARWELPEERRLGQDANRNAALIDAVCHPNAPRFDPTTGALTATGGICQPVNVDYAVPTFATPNRPIRDGLPPFEVTRGGLRYVQPPDIAEWEGATGVWTSATDAEPGSATKPVKTLACGNEESVVVEAVSTRIGFGNMQGRFAPEQVAANTDMAMAAAARVAENNLLTLLEAACVKNIQTAKNYGATRDLLTAFSVAVAAYRNIHRIPPTQTITAILPMWAKEVIRADILRETAHGNSSDYTSFAITDEQINEMVETTGLTPIWHFDGQAEPTSKNYKAQTFIAPVEGKKLTEAAAWGIGGTGAKEGIVWYLFAEGAVQYLDGGRLDLGVVRDATLDATNDYEVFWEVFESIAFRGFAKGAWQMVSTVSPTGGSSATVTAVGP
jgi:hypothetical protein